MKNTCLNEKRVIIFDLDGTLTESHDGIINSTIYMLKKRKLPVPPRNEMLKMIGPPLKESFANLFGVPKADIEDAIKDYREYYTDKGMFENNLYKGIPELLKSLSKNGKTLAVATSKAEPYAIEILKHFGLWKYMTVVRGSGLNSGISEKDEVLAATLEDLKKLNVSFEKSEAVMIGDRKYDIIGAKVNGISSIGVLFGYGSREELESSGADALAADSEELRKILTTKV